MFSLLSAAILLVLIALTLSRHVKRWSTMIPPGPAGNLFVGNLRDLTTHEQWKRAANWGKKYGDLVYIRVFGTSFVFLNSAKATMDLLHTRGDIYSDRPHLTMASDLCGMGGLVPLTRYGDRFRLERRLMQQALSPSAVKNWQTLVVKETHLLLNELCTSPDEFTSHIKRMASSLIFTVLYGYSMKSDHDPYIQAAEEFMAVSSYAITAGWLVDFLPFLRWIPHSTFHRIASKWRAKQEDWVERPHAMFKALADSTLRRTSFCGNLLIGDNGQWLDTDRATEERVKWVTTSMYGAGSDTTVVTLCQFILVMVLHPDVQKRAQAEIDRVVGSDRLPSFDDRPDLPYLECILKEVLRWGTPVPLTPPHRLIQPDVYRGYTLPEGTNCIANMWAILHDEELYANPHDFIPERFEKSRNLKSAEAASDPMNFAFGFGRRRCPGLHFANQSLWFAMVSILASFTMEPAINDLGIETLPEVAFEPGTFRHPKPFQCRITARGKSVRSLIETAATAAQSISS